ncbi:caspase family protein [Nonomuraea jiangxiensis]|uniref:Caspase domain-containing protein n=1 Tax=Nonomuraea jiangxiensis TaxID=633440 RepID=A0A1G9MHU3_9ACTN|nr:caspase family protein [Nonomuraea jiangxiensis]SDL73842.1 Caspase domain-containing protein [Nonomuraea jiangxiensis]
MASETIQLQVRVIDAAADPQELDSATASLRNDLLELDVVVSAGTAGEAPEGSRAVLSFTLGGMVIALAGTELLASIVNAVTAWLNRHQHRSVKLEVDGDVLELTGIRAVEQRELTEVWLRRRNQPDAPGQAGRRLALIVASDEFRDPGLRRLRAPALDADALTRVLGDENIGGFDVRTMLNEPTAVINEAVEEFFADRHPDDLLLLHFSGHGVKDDNGELYFATPSTKLNRLGATAVSAEFVNRRMSRSRCRRIVLLLDCCYAGAFARGALPRAGSDIHVEEQFGGRGRVVITASNALEYAFDGPDLADAQETSSPSVFTSALVEGLETGEADQDQDGYVGIQELYDFIYDKVRAVTPKQTPGKWTFDVQGELIIARRGRPVDRPAPLPSELQEAIDHPIAKIREGAIDELARLRHSRHAGLALAARLALEELTHDDSRSVSAAATRALGLPAASSPPAPSPAAPSPPPASRPAASPPPATRPAASRPPASAPPASAPAASAPAASPEVPGPAAAPPRAAAPPATPPTSPPVSSTAAPPAAPPAAPVAVTGATDRATPADADGAADVGRDTPVDVTRAASADAASGTLSGQAWPALALRGVALLSGLLLMLGPGFAPVLGGRELVADYLIWYWFLIAAAFAVGLLPEGRRRTVGLGASAALAALHLGVFAHLQYFTGTDVLTVVAAMLILAVVFTETALAQPGREWWKVAGSAGGLLALVMIYVNQRMSRDIADDPGEETPWLVVFSAVVLLLGYVVTRLIRGWRAGEKRPPLVLGAVATFLVFADVCAIYLMEGGSDYPQIPAYLPALLVLLLMAAQTLEDRPELLVAVQLTVIAGMVHNLALVRTWPVFVTVLFAAAVCAGAAVYLPGRRAARPR